MSKGNWVTPAGFDSDQKIFFKKEFISSFFFCSKFLCFDVIDCLVLKTAEFHTKKGVIEATLYRFWLVRGFKHQPIIYSCLPYTYSYMLNNHKYSYSICIYSGLLTLFVNSKTVYYPIVLPLPLMECGAAEATGLNFVCFVVINPRVLSANRVNFGLFLFHKFSNFTPPPPIR